MDTRIHIPQSDLCLRGSLLPHFNKTRSQAPGIATERFALVRNSQMCDLNKLAVMSPITRSHVAARSHTLAAQMHI